MTAAKAQEWESYLTRHCIGTVIECALAKLLTSLPDQPFIALAQHDQNIAANPKGGVVSPAPDAKAAKEYLRAHKLQEALDAVVNQLLAAMPQDPAHFMAEKLQTFDKAPADAQKVPLSHTMFSWSSGQHRSVPEGHTAFSWRGGAPMEDGGEEGALLTKLDQQLAKLDGLNKLLYHTRLAASKKRMAAVCAGLGLYGPRLVAVPVHYYDLELEQRKALLDAPSTAHLCKTIILENTQCTRDDCSDPNNSRYYGVVVQYVARLNADKVMRLVKSWNDGIGKSKFNFQLCPNEVSERISGYKFNAVAPVGLVAPIPIILSHRILELKPAMFWMGGGHPDLKLGLGVAEFLEKAKARSGDVTY